MGAPGRPSWRWCGCPQSAPRGGHGGGGGGAPATRPVTLNLSKHVDHPVIVKLSGGRQGTLAPPNTGGAWWPGRVVGDATAAKEDAVRQGVTP